MIISVRAFLKTRECYYRRDIRVKRKNRKVERFSLHLSVLGRIDNLSSCTNQYHLRYVPEST